MTKKLNDIIGEVRSSLRTVADVNEEIESYLRFISTLSEEEFEEEYNQLDELSKATLNSYFNKASDKYKKIKEDITEAKAVSPTLAAKRALQGVADSVGKNKEGHLVARREFFYRHGGTSEKFAGEVSRALTKAGVKRTVVDHDEHWAPFRGGASVKNSSHWAAHIKVHDGE